MEKLWKANIYVQIHENHTQNNVEFCKKVKSNKVIRSDIKVGVINCQGTHLHVSSYNRAFHDYRSCHSFMTTVVAKNIETAYVQTSIFLHEQSDQRFAIFYSNSTFYTPHKKFK